MAKAKTELHYRSVQKGATTIEIPVADSAESQMIMELNFNHFINVLSDILVKHAGENKCMDSNKTENFERGQTQVTPGLPSKRFVFVFAGYIYIF